MKRDRYSLMPPENATDRSESARVRVAAGAAPETELDVDNTVSDTEEGSSKSLKPSRQLSFWRGLWWPT